MRHVRDRECEAGAVDIADTDIRRSEYRRSAFGHGDRCMGDDGRRIDEAESDDTGDDAAEIAGCRTVVGLKREGRRGLAAVMHEPDVACAQIGAGEGGRIGPVNAVGGNLKRAVADIRDLKREVGAVRIACADI